MTSSAEGPEKNLPCRLSNASFSRADIGNPVTNPKCVCPPETISPITRISGSTSVTYCKCVILSRAGFVQHGRIFRMLGLLVVFPVEAAKVLLRSHEDGVEHP